MYRMVDYIILSLRATPAELERAVQEKMIEDWWEPLGPPFYSEGSMWCQAMVRRKET